MELIAHQSRISSWFTMCSFHVRNLNLYLWFTTMCSICFHVRNLNLSLDFFMVSPLIKPINTTPTLKAAQHTPAAVVNSSSQNKMEASFSLLFLFLLFTLSEAVTFKIINECPYTVWAAAVPGGGRRLDNGQSWTINVNDTNARVWARTGCSFDGDGNGVCLTGDCGGQLACTGYGAPPNTLAEFSLDKSLNLDYFDISLLEGFNVPMDFSPTRGCEGGIRCSANIIEQCPKVLKAPGGCYNPCTIFKTNEYCCYYGSCGPTNYSTFFKQRCQDAYSYPEDHSSAFTCPGGTNYTVTLCP